VNRGAAASRNLGIQNASGEYLAFLDADDFYLPRRFGVARAILESNRDIEGVLEATGTQFDTQEAERRWLKMGAPLLTTISAGVTPERIFQEHSPIGQSGHCHLNGLTLRREVISKMGLFDEDVVLVEDTVFFMKLAACATLRLGVVDRPVAMRRVHATNRITKERGPDRMWQDRMTIWLHVFSWLKQRGGDEEKEQLMLGKMLWDSRSIMPSDWMKIRRFAVFMKRAAIAVRKEPSLLRERTFLVGVLKNLRALGS